MKNENTFDHQIIREENRRHDFPTVFTINLGRTRLYCTSHDRTRTQLEFTTDREEAMQVMTAVRSEGGSYQVRPEAVAVLNTATRLGLSLTEELFHPAPAEYKFLIEYKERHLVKTFEEALAFLDEHGGPDMFSHAQLFTDLGTLYFYRVKTDDEAPALKIEQRIN